MYTLSDGHNKVFDAFVVVKAFLDDKNSHQLELPQLTAVQRRQIKSIAEQYPELSCETFGFGTERRLHIFKKASDGISPNHQDSASITSAAKYGGESLERTTSSDESTAASTSSPLLGTRGSPTDTCDLEPSLPHGLLVRNTFIDVEDKDTEKREVQSMPHGMFRQCLMEEIDERRSSEGESPSVHPAMSNGSTLAPGALVVIQGLQKVPASNGARGTVRSLDRETGRYDILLTSPASLHKLAKVKPENLLVISTVEPQSRPAMIDLDCDNFDQRESPGLEGFPSTPAWDNYCAKGYQLLRTTL
jgi:hypothetical protein